MKPLNTLVSLPIQKFRWLLGLTSVAVAGCIFLGGFLVLRMDFPDSQAQKIMNQREIATAVNMYAQKSEESIPHRDATATLPKLQESPLGSQWKSLYNPLPSATPAGAPGAQPPHYIKGPMGEQNSLKTGGELVESMTRVKASASTPESYAKKPDVTIYASAAAASTLNGPALERNYGIQDGVQMAYNVNYQMEVKDALKGARMAQDAVRKHGGFTMDFQFNGNDGEIPTASFHGKIPSKDADSVLEELEKLGQMRSITIAGEDLTMDLRRNENELKYQTGQAATEIKRQISELALKHDLVEFTATFAEPKPRERMTLATVARTTKEVLKYALLAVMTLAVILLGLTLLITPIVILRRQRKKAKAEQDLPKTQTV